MVSFKWDSAGGSGNWALPNLGEGGGGVGRRNLEEEGRLPLYSWARLMASLRVNTSLSSQAWLS